VEIRAVATNAAAGEFTVIQSGIPVPVLAPGDVFVSDWIETKKVFLGKDLYQSFSAVLSPPVN